MHKSLSWKVKNFDFNQQMIKDYDVLKYREDQIKELKKQCATREEFAGKLLREFHWQYWSRSEYELIIEITEDERILLRPWAGCRDEELFIDVTDDTAFDWKGFAAHHVGKQIYENKAKIDIYSQLCWKWHELVDLCWYTRLKWERKHPKFEKGERK